MEHLHINGKGCQSLLSINNQKSTSYSTFAVLWGKLLLFQYQRAQEVFLGTFKSAFHINCKTFPIFFFPNVSALKIRDT